VAIGLGVVDGDGVVGELGRGLEARVDGDAGVGAGGVVFYSGGGGGAVGGGGDVGDDGGDGCEVDWRECGLADDGGVFIAYKEVL